MSQVKHHFEGANNNLRLSCEWLEYLILEYQSSDLPKQTINARVAALKGKIGVINSFKLDPEAHPWSEDM